MKMLQWFNGLGIAIANMLASFIFEGVPAAMQIMARWHGILILVAIILLMFVCAVPIMYRR
jgi:hypothetical protein